MKKEDPLVLRLYFCPWLYQLARLVAYEGIAEAELAEKLKPLAEQYPGKMALALSELTYTFEGIVKLRKDVVPLCRQLLGPPPGQEGYRQRNPTPVPVKPEPTKIPPRKRRRKG